ncbi:MAG: DEAD/DEAH box helicase [Candidatus Gracilibacteria bacterium]|nr:DEAD/DEAH box helicase [Candidatus Gracilibacteria bacterium]
MFAIVIPFSRSMDDKGFFYIIPEKIKDDIKIGQIVKVPFGQDEILAIVLDIVGKTDIPEDRLREILEITFNKPLINQNRGELIKYISSHYYNLIHNSLALFLPKNLRGKLEKNKLKLETKNTYNYSFNTNKALTAHQAEVLEKINNSNNNKILLFGVTGSGKTEIYVNLIKNALDENKQALILVPEIILTSQIANYIKNVFGEDVIIITSDTSEAQKTKYFIDIEQNKAKIIIGTRSALFYPYDNLDIIIIDEEHDDSYLSKDTPRYDGVLTAMKMSDIYNCRLLLASATPKTTHLYKTNSGELELVNLIEEYKK